MSKSKNTGQYDEKKPAEKDELAEVQDFFDDLTPGKSVSVFRVHPHWCAGFLERIDVIEEEPIDLEYLVKRWGGKVLRLKRVGPRGKFARGSVDLILRSYPPKVRGVPVTEEELEGLPRKGAPGLRKQDMEKTLNEEILEQLREAAQPQESSSIGDFAKLLEVVNGQQGPLLKMLLSQGMNRNPQIAQAASPIVQVADMLKQFEAMRGYFSGFQQPVAVPQQTEDNTIITTIGEVLKTLLQKPQQQVQQGMHNPNGLQGVPNPNHQQNYGHVTAPEPTPVQSQTQQGGDFSQALSSLPPAQILDTVLTTFSQMTQDQKGEIKDMLDSAGYSQQIVDALCEDDEPDEPTDPQGSNNQESPG